MDRLHNKAELAWQFLRRNIRYKDNYKNSIIDISKCDKPASYWGLLFYSNPNVVDLSRIHWDYCYFNRAVYFVPSTYFCNHVHIYLINLETWDGVLHIRDYPQRKSIVLYKNEEVLELILPNHCDPKYIKEGYVFFAPTQQNILNKLMHVFKTITSGRHLMPSNKYKKALELLEIINLLECGLSQKDIASKLYSAAEMVEWEPDSKVRAKVRYKIQMAKQFVRYNYCKVLSV